MAKFSIFNIDVEVDDSDVIEYVVDNYHPQDVFPEEELVGWAERNGYEMEDD